MIIKTAFSISSASEALLAITCPCYAAVFHFNQVQAKSATAFGKGYCPFGTGLLFLC